MTQAYSIQWDPSLPPFAGPGSELPAVGYAVEAMADGTNFGNPQALLEVVKSLLTDGSLAVLEGWDNREAPIRLRLSAPTAIAGPALAEAEKALMLAVQARTKAPLVYVPPAQDAVTCVFDVVAAKLERDTDDGWDIDEIRREYRFYLLTLTCLPFARTEESVVVPALPAGGSTEVTVDNCLSNTGWSVGSFNVLSGPPPTSTMSGATNPHADLIRTGFVAMGATPYLKITATATIAGSSVTPSFLIDGTPYSPLASVGNVYYIEPPASFSSLTIRASAVPATRVVTVTNVSRTDFISTMGSARQQARISEVAGSAPTQAAVRLYDATPAALGSEILVHTSRNLLWQPALRRHRVSSAGVTADAARVSGSRNTLSSPTVFRIPVGLIAEGTYALMALMNVTTGGAVGWSTRMVSSSGATTIGSAVTTSGSIDVPVTTGYEVLNLAAISLPVVRAEADQLIELTLTGTANMTLDEGWLFGLDDGALTWIRDSGSTLQWIEIRSPELDYARPSVYGGAGAIGAGAVCVDFMCESFGTHRFEPGLMQVFTVASTSTVSQSELEFYPRYHSHVEGSAV